MRYPTQHRVTTFFSRLADDGRPLDVQRVAREVIERAYPALTLDEQGRPLEMADALRRFVARRQPT